MYLDFPWGSLAQDFVVLGAKEILLVVKLIALVGTSLTRDTYITTCAGGYLQCGFEYSTRTPNVDSCAAWTPGSIWTCWICYSVHMIICM